MEQTGEVGHIQISPDTAKLLSDAGKSKWYEPREGKITVKGKGEIQTYYITRQSGADSKSMGSLDHSDDSDEGLTTFRISDKLSRLIEWNVDHLYDHLKMIVSI